MTLKNMNYYYCSKCHTITQRESKAQKIKSMCDTTGKTVFITRIKNADELAKRLSGLFVNRQFDLSTFKPKEKLQLKMAFEQGVKVVYNGINR